MDRASQFFSESVERVACAVDGYDALKQHLFFATQLGHYPSEIRLLRKALTEQLEFRALYPEYLDLLTSHDCCSGLKQFYAHLIKTGIHAELARSAMITYHTRTGKSSHALRLSKNTPSTYLKEHRVTLAIAETLLSIGKVREANDRLLHLLDMDDTNAEAYLLLGYIEQALGEWSKAKEIFEELVEQMPDHVRARLCFVKCLLNEGKVDSAINLLQKGIAISPLNAKQYFALANCFTAVGDYGAARSAYLRCQLLDPDHAGCLSIFLEHQNFCKDQVGVFNTSRSLLSRKETSNLSRIELYFGLTSYYERLRNFKAAQQTVIRANRLQRRLICYHHRAYFHAVQSTISLQDNLPALDFSPERVNQVHPILMVGMPSSGSTLIEQALICHAEISSAGELAALSELWRKYTQSIEDAGGSEEDNSEIAGKLLQRVRYEYLGLLEQHRERESKYVIDKMPFNYTYIGFALALFPETKIIYVKREPVANCLSIFFRRFSPEMGFAFQSNEIAQRFVLHQSVMDFWIKRYKERILPASYDSLVGGFQVEMNRILEWLDLEWTEDIMQFHRHKRPVRTSSWNDVRRPLYSTALEKWKNHKPLARQIRSDLRRAERHRSDFCQVRNQDRQLLC